MIITDFLKSFVYSSEDELVEVWHKKIAKSYYHELDQWWLDLKSSSRNEEILRW